MGKITWTYAKRGRGRPRTNFKKKKDSWTVGLATKPQLMPKTLSKQRSMGVDTRVFWFKYNEQLAFASGITTNFTFTPLYNINQFRIVQTLYEQYKVLAMNVVMYPANIYADAHDPQGPPRALLRGNGILLVDQNFKTDGTEDPPIASIANVINNSSCRMINQARVQKRTMYRPTGQDEWFSTAGDEFGEVLEKDSWFPAVRYFREDSTTAGGATQWYTVTTYKVIWRARTDRHQF